MGLVLGEDLAQVRGVDDEDPVEEFAAYAAYPAFHDRVHAWRPGSGEHDPDALGAEHVVEHRGELGVAVTDQEFEVACVATQIEHQVAGLPGDPCGGRVRGDTEDLDPAGGVLDHGEAVQPGQRDRVGVEEITGEDPLGLTRRNWHQLGPDRRGTGSMPASCRIRQTVAAPIFRPSPANSPVIRRYPQVEFSAARRSTSARIAGRVGGRPGSRWG
jgi:hypothetical protein